MSPVPPDATGSYGADAVKWIEKAERKRLRWWQRLAITRQLEHRADGSLCHRVILESAPRRAGKSVRVRGVALWRMANAELFGEEQTVIHTGQDMAICREIQRGAWVFSERSGWSVTRGNGKEAIETATGDRWLIRSQDAVYGYDVCLGMVDEAWDVKPDTVTEGLEPATLERSSPQLHLTSTAHRRATSLMVQFLRAALTMEDDGTLLMVWAAPPGADPSDPEVWKAASPHWSEDRRRMITGKYARALAGEADPDADDPDPMAGFTAQYLNSWRLETVSTEKGDPAVSSEEWQELAAAVPDRHPDGAAVESWFGDGMSVSLAWREDELVLVRSIDVPDLPAAAAVLKHAGVGRRTVLVGESLMDEQELRVFRLKKASGRAAAAVLEVARLISEDALRHDGGTLLTEQITAARTMPGADGPRMVSTGRFDAVKTAVWAAGHARRRRPSGGGIIAV